ncbi:cytochrome D ubiquinol oxidase subunit II [Catellatospora methionotrophica]|uniref:Cytochrome D ubiquinol oxidase subunit II n=1 Tax=Catellatospora methionotrophica TaxID=121620 RepID=A0A8J3LNZ5_9ACTN|nr:cytochrome d ubiquinol oxidase subunit II [Catellatospora methionotrophica]GIG18085.1 cytochrome D ubiquinol oxidase subunit II [Catellatospora methionotrophica]
MSAADAVAVLVVLAVTLYAWSGFADYGAGFWDLTAGGHVRGVRVRSLIDAVITPVWEANHVWLVYLLVVTWTSFGAAFASIMSTLFIPLSLAALGIVLRGANFALRKDAAREGRRQAAGVLFGFGAVLTPFCFGAVLGGIITGRVPPGDAAGDELTSWWNPTSIMVGLLAVAMGAFLAAVYLIAEAHRRGLPGLREYFRRRALGSGAVAVLFGVGALVALHGDAPQMFDRFVTRGSVLLVLGLILLGVTFWMAARGAVRGLRLTALGGVAALVWSWGVAQYPYLLPFGLTIEDGSGAAVTQRWILAWFGVALVTLVPALILLYVLDQRGELGEDPLTSLESAEPGDLRS